jgi:hypothetical protein
MGTDMAEFSMSDLEAVLAVEGNPDLAKQHGMVTQVWSDGEVTCQKSGDLLWQRSLHQVTPPCVPNRREVVARAQWHGSTQNDSNKYLYVADQAAAKRVRAALRAWNDRISTIEEGY